MIVVKLATINVQNNGDITTQRPLFIENMFWMRISSNIVVSGDFGYAITCTVVSNADRGISWTEPSEQNDPCEHWIHWIKKALTLL